MLYLTGLHALNLLAEKKFSLISNFKDDFICNDSYTQEIFEKVYELQSFLGRESPRF